MSKKYRQLVSCSPSAYDNTYIFHILPSIGTSLAAITSADEVLIVDGAVLSSTSVSRFVDSPKGLTTLSVSHDGRTLFCGDKKGLVSCLDVRTGAKSGSITVGRGVTALQCRGNDLGVGTEVMHQQAIVSVWDLRTSQMRWQNAENNDDITALDFHPTRENIILVGGDDGLVSLFDVNVAEEDDSLVQAVNHGPIHKVGFLQSDALFALSSDQNLSLHPIYSPERDQEPDPVLFGDLRPIIPCEYVIDVVRTGPDHAVAAGSHSRSRVDIVNIQNGTTLDTDKRVVLEGAHGEEIVRSLLISDENNIIFSAGEDGRIKAFGPA